MIDEIIRLIKVERVDDIRIARAWIRRATSYRPFMGAYPDVALKEARGRRDSAREHLAHGADPGAVRKATERVMPMWKLRRGRRNAACGRCPD